MLCTGCFFNQALHGVGVPAIAANINIEIPPGMDADALMAAGHALIETALDSMGSVERNLFFPRTSDGSLLNDLEKAVNPHRAHITQRSRTGRFLPWKWRRETARDLSGKFISRLSQQERDEASRLAAEYQGNLLEKLDWTWYDVNREALDPAEGARRGRRYIAEYYTHIFRTGMQAAGNPAIVLSPRDKAVLNRIALDEGDYWDGFMRDVADGKGRVPYAARAAMYGNAAREAYWIGFILGNVSPRRRLIWHLGPTEHCTTCLYMQQHGPWTVEDFLKEALAKGFVPQSGYLECLGLHCKCWLTDNLPAST